MFSQTIANVPVEFPYQPYECQKAYMSCVISALNNSSNAALESPTGTGKTLSLLCASLSWLEKCKAISKVDILNASTTDELGTAEKSKLFPTVIYASRTHSQLQQVVRELNKTRYKYMRTCILASRDQLCINEKLMKEENNQIKGQMCRNMVKTHKCVYYNSLERDNFRLNEMYKSENVPDIEEVVATGKKFRHCPYFRTQDMMDNADLILLPYNYVFDPKIRQAMKIKLRGNILLVDEAHNLESTCEDSVSIEWSAKDTALCLAETKKVIELMRDDKELDMEEGDESNIGFHQLDPKEVMKAASENKPKVKLADVVYLLERLNNLEVVIEDLSHEPMTASHRVNGVEGCVHPGEKMVALLEKAEFTRSQRDGVVNVIDGIGLFLAKHASKNSGLWAERGMKLAEFAVLISRVFADSYETPGVDTPITKTSANEACKNFLLYVAREANDIKLKYWCFSASMAMKLVNSRGLRSVIVTSGTLSPLSAFLTSLGIQFRYKLENKHIATPDQIVVGALRTGPNKNELLGTFRNRTNNNYLTDMALTLLKTMQVTPQGMLVFFSSYTQMSSMIECFRRLRHNGSSFWMLMEKCKRLFIEPKSKTELPMLLTQFDGVIRNGKGAAFFAVCRGKISEGIDLPDSHCRAVFLCGIPFAPPNDPRVVLKKHFLQLKILKKENAGKVLSPDEWYKLEGLKAVNQAIGRIIRHKDDFGIVVLADLRFAAVQESHLSAWIRPSMKAYNTPENFFELCERFFSERETLIQKSYEKLKLGPKLEVMDNIQKKTNENGGVLDDLNSIFFIA
ncbi:hypothetical protein FO519_003470 [Halicephalobus sp. NKZ332]|nr:hypothetical protein FO519_003470 [Halicephalobus sp. NKZ332]